jgi:hypothetical protein
MKDFTTSQKAAYEKARELLHEHFEFVIIALETEVEDGTDRAFDGSWKGGLSACIGLSERFKNRLLSKSEVSDSETE